MEHGINKHVTEMTEETQDDHIDYIGECTGKFVANARLKQTSMTTTSSSTTALPYHLRVWIDMEPGPYDKSCFKVSKKDDQIASTRSFSSSRRRRSTNVSFIIYVFSVLVNSNIAELLAKRRWS